MSKALSVVFRSKLKISKTISQCREKPDRNFKIFILVRANKARERAYKLKYVHFMTLHVNFNDLKLGFGVSWLHFGNQKILK